MSSMRAGTIWNVIRNLQGKDDFEPLVVMKYTPNPVQALRV